MRLLLFADIHIGSIQDTTYVYNTMTKIIDKEIIFQKTDAVIILGDYFHRLFKVNEEYVSLAINVMSYLIRACMRNNTKIRIVYGTESHEMSQYRLFNYHVTSSNVDIKLFTGVAEEELFPGCNVLYLPEEYINSKAKHYKKTLYGGKHYQYIFGHGVIEEGVPPMMAAGGKPPKNGNHKEKFVPHFKNRELASISDLCVFGHYHCYTDIGDNVFYLGSLFRNCFGEETPKGYGVVEDGKLTFVENTDAYVYRTYWYKRNDPIFKGSDKITAAIDKIKADNPSIFDGSVVGRIRMMFNAPATLDDSWRESLRTILKTEKSITASIKDPMVEVQEEIEENYGDEYDFILDDGLSLADKVFRYISITHPESNLTFKEVSDYVTKAVSRK